VDMKFRIHIIDACPVVVSTDWTQSTAGFYSILHWKCTKSFMSV